MAISGDTEDRATTEAAHWLVALEDDPGDPAQRARFDAWMAADPANAAAWRHTSDIYGMMARTPPAHAEHWAMLRGNAVAAVVPFRRPVRTRHVGAGAIAALAAGLALFVSGPSVLLRLQADYTTATAEQRQIQLMDGSTVRLAPDSALAVAFDGGERHLRLLKGEAFFEVAHDPNHPFLVDADDVRTTDIGTGFDVRRDGAAVSVAVRHGKVRVGRVGELAGEELDPGDRVSTDMKGVMRRDTTPPDEIAPWLDGQIVARDRPIGDVVDELRLYYRGAIVAVGGTLYGQRVTGVYNVADPVSALKAIAGAHGGTVREITPWLLVVSGG